MIIPVIMSGGAGTRLWPLAREQRPKPLLPLVDGTSTFASTLARVSDAALFGEPLVVANVAHRHMLKAAIAETGGAARLLLEPEPRDTTAAIAAAARGSPQRDPDAILLFLAADHLVRDIDGFRRTVAQRARPRSTGRSSPSASGRPTHPTSYGYIERGEPLPGGDGLARVRGLRREARRPDGAPLPRGRLSLEQRQLHDVGGARARRACRPRARHPRRDRGGGGGRQHRGRRRRDPRRCLPRGAAYLLRPCRHGEDRRGRW